MISCYVNYDGVGVGATAQSNIQPNCSPGTTRCSRREGEADKARQLALTSSLPVAAFCWLTFFNSWKTT